MNIGEFELANTAKLDRAKAQLPESASDQDILVAYDKLGGLITKGGQKIKTGCFYNPKTKAAVVDPKAVYLYAVNGRIIEVPEGSELPGEVRAAKILEEEDNKERAKNSKGKKKLAAAEETEDGEDE
jgi:hypothetical protein